MSTSRSSADMIQIRAKLLLFQSIDLWTNKKVEFAIYISFTCPYPIFDAPRIERTFVIKTISTICRRSRDTCLFYFFTIPITNVFTYSMIFTVLFSDYFSRRMGGEFAKESHLIMGFGFLYFTEIFRSEIICHYLI